MLNAKCRLCAQSLFVYYDTKISEAGYRQVDDGGRTRLYGLAGLAPAKAPAKARINTATTISAHSTRLLQNKQDYKSLQADYKSLEQRVTALEDAQKPGNN